MTTAKEMNSQAMFRVVEKRRAYEDIVQQFIAQLTLLRRPGAAAMHHNQK